MATISKGSAFVDKAGRPKNVSLPGVGKTKVPTVAVKHAQLMEDAKNTFKKNSLKGNSSR